MRLLGRIAESVGDYDARPRRSWIGWVVAAVVAFVGLLIGWWVLGRDRRELARLRHAEAVRAIEARAAVDAFNVKQDTIHVDALRAKAELARDRARQADADMAEAEERYARDLRAVDRIRSWRDVDFRPGG